MPKLAKKKSAAQSAAASRKRSKSKNLETKGAGAAARSGTKQSAAIEILRSREGTSIDALSQATGWQRHSVRGFLAGVVRKRLKLNLESVVLNGVRTYRITGDHGPSSPKKQPSAQRS